MTDSIFKLSIFFLSCFLSLNSFAETSTNNFTSALYLNLNTGNDNPLQHIYSNQRLIINEPRLAKARLGMVFTPEDLLTISSLDKTIESQVTPAENRETIIAVYYQAFF